MSFFKHFLLLRFVPAVVCGHIATFSLCESAIWVLELTKLIPVKSDHETSQALLVSACSFFISLQFALCTYLWLSMRFIAATVTTAVAYLLVRVFCYYSDWFYL